MHNVKRLIASACILVFVLISGIVMANDGRINPPPYHFGGDALYCNPQDGCTLLNKTGQFLFNWSQDEINAAVAILDQTGQNSLVAEGFGTYGSATLWAMPAEESNGNNRLCFFAYDEWGKQNHMCFALTADGKYLPAPLAVGTPDPESTPEATPDPIADCSLWSVSGFVRLLSDPSTYGPITSINTVAGTLTFSNYNVSGEPPVTAACDQVEEAPS